ncbi:MAG: ATP-dependent helicase [Chloroherpetonaceae bacterium]|nr:ATP-dependent helicase [Chthonomonadaceae bacterium]MDW8206395.1 ATP-dependent helicase [Chloroherpetonaceae bacterium]
MADQEDMSAEQRAAVWHDEGPAAVFAGPGSGKTRVVTLRAARLAAQGRRLLVTTFTNDATMEMRARLERLLAREAVASVHVTTLHALCLQILRSEGKAFHLLTDEFQRRRLAEAAGAAELDGGIAGMLARLSYQKNLGVTHRTYRHDGSADDIAFARAWQAYEKAKSERGLREFDDLLLDVCALLEGDEALRRRVAARYTHLIVDECQDMNAPQYAVIFALGRDHKNVMLVGDLDQSLYGFRGADTRTFRHFAAHPRTTVYELRENFRSTRAIVTLASSLIRQDPHRWPLELRATRPEGEPVIWERYPDPDVEALAVGEQILRLNQRGVRFQDMAVLYRANAQSEAFERHFTALGIPFVLREEGDFYARKEVQGILAYLHFFAPSCGVEAADPAREYPDEWLLALLHVPYRRISRSTGGQLRNWAEIRNRRIWDILPEFHAEDLKSHRGLRRLRQELEAIGERVRRVAHAGEAIQIVRQVTGFDLWLRHYEKDDRDNDRIQNVQRMQAAAAHYPTIAEYLQAVQRVRDEAARRRAARGRRRKPQDEVTLATGHAAKGLEWRYVFAAGWSEELLPHRKAEDIDEERRIAYVIVTRARDRLFLSSVDRWNDTNVAPSRFLTGLQVTAPCGETRDVPEELSASTPEPAEALGGLFLMS